MRVYLRWLNCLTALTVIVPSFTIALAQGTVTFNGAANFSGTDYYEQGVWFQVVVPSGSAHDDMGGLPAILGPSNVPYNTTPYMVWFRQFNPSDYVAFSVTNGSAFGLASVQVADPNSPSYSALPITFKGFKVDGSTVTNTFTTPGNGADHLLNYQFTSDFASGLTSVDILATRWAMDNLAFTVPEPATGSLLVLGLLAFAVRKRCRAKAKLRRCLL